MREGKYSTSNPNFDEELLFLCGGRAGGLAALRAAALWGKGRASLRATIHEIGRPDHVRKVLDVSLGSVLSHLPDICQL